MHNAEFKFKAALAAVNHVATVNEIAQRCGLHTAMVSSGSESSIAVGTSVSRCPPAQIRKCGITAYGSYLGCDA